MSNENDIGLTINTGPLQQGVDKSIAALDRLIGFMEKFDQAIQKNKVAGATALSGTLADQAKHNKSMIAKFEELRQEQLIALQNGNIGTADLTRKQNAVLQGLYDARKAIVGKFTTEELAVWQKLRVSLGKIEQAQLDERKAAQKTEAASAAAHMAEMKRLTAQGFAEQRQFITEAARLYKQLTSGKNSLTYNYKKDTETALGALRQFYKIEEAVRNNAGKQSALVGTPLSSIRTAMELDSEAILASLRKFYTVAESIGRTKAGVGSPLASIRLTTAEDSSIVLSEMRRFYTAAQTINANFGKQTALAGSPLSSIRTNVKLDSEAILADMRKFYSDQERIMRNIENTRRGMSANMGVGRKTPGIDDRAAASAAALAQTRAMYLEAGAVSSYAGTSAETAKMNAMATAAPKAGAALRGLGGDMNYAHSMARGLASGFGLLWLTWGSLAPLFIGAALSNGFVQTAKTGMDVAHTFGIIENVGGNTRKEVQALHEELLILGRNGPFGPREIADAMKVLSLAGLDANKILSVTKDVMNFSVAGTTNLTTAAETLMTVSTAFGMGAAGFGRVSDVISKAAATSLTSVESFSNAMKTASVINAQYGVSLEDTATAIAAMSQLGIQGTAAGTALRNMYADLSGRSGQVAKVLKSQNIEMRDSTGAMRPMIEVVGQLSSKLKSLDGISQKNLLQALLSERGAKGMIELLRLVETEGVGSLSNALEDMRSQIADSAGFAAITAAKMAQTTKSQFEAVKASLATAMDEAYQAMAPQLSLIFDSLKKTFASPEFVGGITTMVTGLATLTQAIAENIKVLAFAFGAYAALATAKAAAAALSAAFAGKLVAETAAKTTAAVATTALARAELAGSAAKVGGVLSLARLIPGLNIAIGLATAAWMAYSYYRDSSNRADADGSALYTNNVVKDLKDQTEKLRRINELRMQGLTLTDAQARLDAEKGKAGALAPGASKIAEAKQAEIAAITKLQSLEKDYASYSSVNTKRQVEEQKKRVQIAGNTVNATIKQQSAQRSAIDNAGKALSAQTAIQNSINDAEMKKRLAASAQFGTGKFSVADSVGGAKAATNAYTAAVVSNAAAIDKQTNAELASSKARFDNESKIAAAQHEAQLLNSGEYQAKLITLTEGYERKQVEVHTAGNARLEAENTRYRSALETEAATDISNSKLNGSELAEYKEQRNKALNEKLKAADESYRASVAQNAAQIEALQLASDQRKELARYAHIAKLKKAEKEAADYIIALRQKRANAAEQDTFDEQWGGVNANSSAVAKASKAAAEAGMQAAQAHRAEIDRLTASLLTAKMAYLSMKAAAGQPGLDPQDQAELTLAADRYKSEMDAAEKQLTEIKIEANKDVAIAAGRAYKKEIRSAQQALADGISDSIVTALLEGGEAGKKKLRDLVVAELQKPIKLYINAFVNTIMGGLTGQNGLNFSDFVSAYQNANGGGGGAGGGAVSAAASAATASQYGTIAGSQQTTMLAAQEGATASAGVGMGYMTYAALIVAAIMIAENLYSKGYSRMALGEGGSETVKAGKFTNYTTDPNVQKSWMNNGILNLMSKDMRNLADKLGMNQKWADILSGTTRMATLIGRKLSAYGMQADIKNGETEVSGFAKYKGGLFRSNKTVKMDVDPRDAELLKLQIEGIKGSARGMALAMGYGTEAIDNYTGSLRVNFKNAKDNTEVAKRMQEAMDELQYSMLKAASGGKLTKEAFNSMLTEAKAAMEGVGISAKGMADILVGGMTGKLSEQEVGDQLAEMIVGGIYNAIASSYANMIADAFMNQIITPIFTAIMAGVPISAAVSAGAIESIVEMANKAAEALNVIFSNEDFRAAMERIGGAIRSISGSVTRVKTPGYNPRANEAASKANEIAQEKYTLETALLTLLGDTNKLRARELAAIDKSNHGLKKAIWAIEDAKVAADKAMETLTRAVEKQREFLDAQLEAAQELEDNLQSVFDTLKDSVRDLRGEAEDSRKMQVEDARRFLAQTATMAGRLGTMAMGKRTLDGSGSVGEYLKINTDNLDAAIESLTDNIESTDFVSQRDKDRANLTLANELEALGKAIEPKLSDSEKLIQSLETQQLQLDAQLKTAQSQLDVLYGVNTSVMTVADAVANLSVQMASYAAAVAAGRAITTSSGAAPTTPVTSGGGGGGGGGSAPKPPKAVWTAQGYWNKNPDLQKEFKDANLEASPDFNKDNNLSARDEYLTWHWNTKGKDEHRKYAKGGYYPGGMALVGELGPELINFRNPGQVYTADETRKFQEAASTGDDTNYNAAILMQLQEAQQLNYSLAASNAKILQLLRRVTRDGVSVNVSAEEPIPTVAA